MSAIGKEKFEALKAEWTIDTLAARDLANAVLMGDDATNDAVASATRVGNFAQISDKVIVIAGTNQAIDSPADNARLEYQLPKKMKELKLDVEAIASQQQASVAPTSAVVGKAGGFESWITSNVSRGAGGANGGYSVGTGLTVAPTDGTQRAFQEQFLKDVLESGWTNGAEPTMVLFGPKNKKQASAILTGIAQPTRETGNKRATVIGASDIYVSDWGEVQLKASRWTRDRSALVIDPELWAFSYSRPFKMQELAKTGDSEKRQVIVEWTLVSKNQAGSGVVADLTTP